MLKDAVRPSGENISKRQLALILSGVRQILGGGRSENLYSHIREAIENLQFKVPPRLLDYGCGSMELGIRLLREGVIGSYLGADTFAMNSQSSERLIEGCSYQQLTEFDEIPSLGNFDLVMLIDVLHHIPIGKHVQLLGALGTTSPYFLVKDHFEEGAISRNLLRLADWFGNYAYGVSIPDLYFSTTSWQRLIDSVGFDEHIRKTPVKIHDGLFGWILPSKYHFLSTLQSAAFSEARLVSSKIID